MCSPVARCVVRGSRSCGHRFPLFSPSCFLPAAVRMSARSDHTHCRRRDRTDCCVRVPSFGPVFIPPLTACRATFELSRFPVYGASRVRASPRCPPARYAVRPHRTRPFHLEVSAVDQGEQVRLVRRLAPRRGVLGAGPPGLGQRLAGVDRRHRRARSDAVHHRVTRRAVDGARGSL